MRWLAILVIGFAMLTIVRPHGTQFTPHPTEPMPSINAP
jgi:hypothetical protein